MASPLESSLIIRHQKLLCIRCSLTAILTPGTILDFGLKLLYEESALFKILNCKVSTNYSRILMLSIIQQINSANKHQEIWIMIYTAWTHLNKMDHMRVSMLFLNLVSIESQNKRRKIDVQLERRAWHG